MKKTDGTISITTKSENTIKAYEFLKQNPGVAFSIKQIGENIGATSAQILGGLTALNTKGAVAKDEADVDGKPAKVYSATDLEVTFVKEEPKNMSDKAVQVLQYLINGGDGQTHKEIAQGMKLEHVAGAVGVVNGLVKKNLVMKEEVEVKVGEGETAETKKLQVIRLTEDGKNYRF